MSISRSTALVVCLAVVSLLCLSAASAEEPVPLTLSRTGAGVWRPDKPVMDWTTDDVVLWLNYTIGYGEYAAFARKHRVDGLTLLEMDAADFETFFPIENGLHAIKMSAHLMYLQRKCHCTSDEEAATSGKSASITSFTGYMRAHPVRTWVEGILTLYFTRWGMLTTYLFDKPLYRAIVNGGANAAPGLSLAEIARMGDDADKLKAAGSPDGAASASAETRPPTWSRTLLYWVSFIIAPDLYMAYQCATHIRFSYVYMGLFTIHFVFQAFNEYVVASMAYRGTAFDANTSWPRRIWQLFSYTLFFPLVAPIIAYVLPGFLQIMTVWALMANTGLMVVGLVMLLIGGEFNHIFFGGAPPGAAQPEGGAAEAAGTSESSPHHSEEPAHGGSKTEKID